MEQAPSKISGLGGAHLFHLFFGFTLGQQAGQGRGGGGGKGKELEYRFLTFHARAMQEQGRLRLSEETTDRALEMEKSQGLKESAEGDLGFLAQVQADLGVCDRALKNAATLAASSSRLALTEAGGVFATCGQGQKAE